MSLLSAILLPQLEKQLVSLEPEIAAFFIGQAKSVGAELIAWAEKKIELPLPQSTDVSQ